MTVEFVRQLARNHPGYENLLLPLILSPERPRSEVLFQQCLLALSAPRVRPQLLNAWWCMTPRRSLPKSAALPQYSERAAQQRSPGAACLV